MLYKAEFIYEEVYCLVLNPMMGRLEETAVFKYNTKKELLNHYNSNLVEPYTENGPDAYNGGVKPYSKTFRKGSPFEMMNKLTDDELKEPNMFGHGVHIRSEMKSGPINKMSYIGPIPD